jgi:hypothetical protein
MLEIDVIGIKVAVATVGERVSDLLSWTLRIFR